MTLAHLDIATAEPVPAAVRARWLAFAAYVAFPITAFGLSFAMPANLATFTTMGLTTGLALLLRPAPPAAGPAISPLFALLVAAYVASLLYHGDSAATVSTSLSVIGMGIAVYLVARRLAPPTDDRAADLLDTLRTSLLMFLGLGLVVSVLAAQVWSSVANPLAALLSTEAGGRLRLLARVTEGHSLLIPASFLVMVAELRLPRGWAGVASIAACTLLLIASGTRVAAAYLAVAVVCAVFRFTRLPAVLQQVVYVTALCAAAAIVWAGSVDSLRPLLEPIQSAVPGLRIINPASALGSGRDLLNDALRGLAEQSPAFGVGYDHQTIAQGPLGAGTAPNESFLRVLATRGWIVALPLVLLFTAPLVSRRRVDPAILAIAAGSSLDIVLNGNVERLSSPASVWLWLIATTILLLPPARAGGRHA